MECRTSFSLETEIAGSWRLSLWEFPRTNFQINPRFKVQGQGPNDRPFDRWDLFLVLELIWKLDHGVEWKFSGLDVVPGGNFHVPISR